MGYVKKDKPVLSIVDKRYWKDKTINSIIRRINDMELKDRLREYNKP